MKNDASCQILPFSRYRRALSDMLGVYAGLHFIHGLIEVDVTEARSMLRRTRHKGAPLSITSFVAACVARAVDENKIVHACLRGRRKLVLFDEVDLNIIVEHKTKEGRVPTPYVIRDASQKTVIQIHDELRAAKRRSPEKSFGPARWMPLLPGFVRRFLTRLMRRNPQMSKRFGGTVAITSIGMFGAGAGWGIPISGMTLMITLGGVARKPAVIDNKIEPREFLSMTLSFDHDIVDGAPAARFTRRLKQLIENCYGLESTNESVEQIS